MLLNPKFDRGLSFVLTQIDSNGFELLHFRTLRKVAVRPLRHLFQVRRQNCFSYLAVFALSILHTFPGMPMLMQFQKLRPMGKISKVRMTMMFKMYYFFNRWSFSRIRCLLFCFYCQGQTYKTVHCPAFLHFTWNHKRKNWNGLSIALHHVGSKHGLKPCFMCCQQS